MDSHFKPSRSQHTEREWGDKVVLRMELTFEARATERSADTSSVKTCEFTDGRISGVDVFYKDTNKMLELPGV